MNRTNMKWAIRLVWAFIFGLTVLHAHAQVQVSKEPRHKPVLQNEYIRLLDVFLTPGDTTFYHIHSTPSVFVYLTSNITASQIMGGQWKNDTAKAGYTWYRSFTPDSVIHRVANIDSKTFHVNDVEILSSFDPQNFEPLSLPVLFESDKAIAYSFKGGATLNVEGHGPMIAELIADNEVNYFNSKTKESKILKQGNHLYIAPNTSFQLKSKGNTEMVLFEIK